MKPFESLQASSFEEYISYRKSLGYTDKSIRATLRPFDLYLVNTPVKVSDISALFILEFKKSLKGQPSTVNSILTGVRGFFDYLVRKELIHCNPVKDVPSSRENAFVPFIFSPEQTDQLLTGIQKRIRQDPVHFLFDLTLYTAALLLARCGLRISEPLRLKRYHYRKDDGSIYIEKTKFSKDRLIPLPNKIITHMDNYLSVRNTLSKNDQNPYLLPGKKHRQLSQNTLYTAFCRALHDTGIDCPRRIVGNTVFGAPTPHSLRHSFAINTLNQIRARGKSPQAALPVLSEFMGHRKYRYTALYLKFLDAQQRQGLVDFSIKAQKDI
jgi:integrase/recombinase XerD